MHFPCKKRWRVSGQTEVIRVSGISHSFLTILGLWLSIDYGKSDWLFKTWREKINFASTSSRLYHPCLSPINAKYVQDYEWHELRWKRRQVVDSVMLKMLHYGASICPEGNRLVLYLSLSHLSPFFIMVHTVIIHVQMWSITRQMQMQTHSLSIA